MYTSVTGIVYIYNINIILSYPLMSSTHTTRPKIKTGNPSPKNPSPTHHKQKNLPPSYHLINYTKSTHNSLKYLKWVRDRVRPHPYISMQNKFSDNSKSPIFTQNYLLQITISLAKSNNLRSPLEGIPNYISQDHKLNLILSSCNNPNSLTTST